MKKTNIMLLLLCTFATSLVMAGPADRLGPSNNLPASGFAAITPFGIGTDLVVDGGFESGTPSAGWTEASTNFGTTICDSGACGTGGGTGPRSGAFWSWFGGIGASEVGTVTQMITIPAGSATLEFWTELFVCDSAADYMDAKIDGVVVYHVQGDDAACGVLGYAMQTVDVSAYADGGTHTLEFTSEIFANNGGGSNFFLDDVALLSVPGVVLAPPTSVPSLNLYALVALFLVLLVFGFKRSRA
jgi:hypothetical protein